ncbi:uncharacterized protein LOC143084929 [Mytilus galloprovincialis]|uniref:uncharacterized protein LOC143084929 n=1 Tax=Mytilus galloprovincialis TaxID=29158 RepID=UPI003F7B8EEF
MTENGTNDFSKKELVKVVSSGIGEPTPGSGLGVIDREAKSFHFYEKEKKESEKNCVKEKENNKLMVGWDNLTSQNGSVPVARPRLIFVRGKYDEFETPIRMNTEGIQSSENTMNTSDDSHNERKHQDIERHTKTLKEEEDESFTVDHTHITLKNASNNTIRNPDKHNGSGHKEKSIKQKADNTRSSICFDEKNISVNIEGKHNKLCRRKKCGSAKANIDGKHCRLGQNVKHESLKQDSDDKQSLRGPGEKCDFLENDDRKKQKNPDKKWKQTKRKSNRKMKPLSDKIKEEPNIDPFKLESVFTDKPNNLYVGLGMQLSPRIRLSPLPIKPKVNLNNHKGKSRERKPPEGQCSEKKGNGVINVRSTEEQIGQSRDNLRLRKLFKKRNSGSEEKIESVNGIKERKPKVYSSRTPECSTSCEDSHDTVLNYFKEIVITDVSQLVPIHVDSITKEPDTSVQNSETQGQDIAETKVDEPANKARSKFKVGNFLNYIDGKLSKFSKLLKN